jgi:hypothetical protein
MDLQEIYSWFESRTGRSFDITESIGELKGSVIFTDPYTWYSGMQELIEHATDCIDTIDEFGNELPDYLPPQIEFKALMNSMFDGAVHVLVNDVKRQIDLPQVTLSDTDELSLHIQTLHELVSMFIDCPQEKIGEAFQKYNEDNDDILTDDLEIHPGDLQEMYITIEGIRENFYNDLDGGNN